jgi:hypothetical protein
MHKVSGQLGRTFGFLLTTLIYHTTEENLISGKVFSAVFYGCSVQIFCTATYTCQGFALRPKLRTL